MKVWLVGIVGVLLAVCSGCITDPWRQIGGGNGLTYLVVTTTDYRDGNVSLISLDDWSVQKDVLSIHSDNGVVADPINSSMYLIERGGPDNLIRYDFNGPALSDSTLSYQKSMGTAVNIKDIAVFSPDKAFATQYASAYLKVINPANGAILDSINLGGAPYVHAGESIPYMDAIVSDGRKIFVALQRLKMQQGPWGPAPGFADSTGMIVVIDPLTNIVIKTIRLAKGNPLALCSHVDKLYISSPGRWDNYGDGGIERINMSTLSYEGVVVEESVIGGDISTLAVVSSSKAYVCAGITDAQSGYATRLIECNPSTGALVGAVAGIANAFGGLVYDGQYVYVGERLSSAPGVMVVNPKNNLIVKGPLNVGAYMPSDMAIVSVAH